MNIFNLSLFRITEITPEKEKSSELASFHGSFVIDSDVSESPEKSSKNSSKHSINIIEDSMSEACEPKRKGARLDLNGSQDSISPEIYYLSPTIRDSSQKRKSSESSDISIIELKPVMVKSDSIEIIELSAETTKPFKSKKEDKCEQKLKEIDKEQKELRKNLYSDNDDDLMEIDFKPAVHRRLEEAMHKSTNMNYEDDLVMLEEMSKPQRPSIHQATNRVADCYEEQLMKLSEKMFEILEQKPDPSQDLRELIEPSS